MNFRAIGNCWLSKTCAIWFVALIVSPTTAPFQAVDLSEIFGTGHHESRQLVRFAHNDSLVPLYRETTVSTMPAPDTTDDRLEGESRVVAAVRPARPTRGPVVRLWRPPADPPPGPSAPVLRV
jgi:hypothetical protein